MDTQLHQHLLLIFIVNCMLVQAEIGDVNVHVRYRVSQCVCNSSSLHDCLTQQTLCLKSSIFRCLQFHKPLTNHYLEMGTLCGVINTGRQLMTHTWHITVHFGFSLQLEFLHFQLPGTIHCVPGTTVTLNTTNINHKYCGHRMPWNIAFPQSHATVKSKAENHTPTGFYFVMIYQAFDIKLPSATSTQWNEYEFVNDTALPRIFTFEYLAIGQEHKFSNIDLQIHITVMVIRRIEIELLSPIPITIYDGPGILSPVILTEPNATGVKLSSYQGFVTYNQRAILTEYSDAKNHSHVNAQVVRWFSHRFFDCYGLHGRNPLWSIHTNQCFYSDSIVTIHQMRFTGYNMLSHNDNSMFSGCQYGGFFRDNHYTKTARKYFKICSNVTKESSISNNQGGWYIFITFQGYSSGFIELAISGDICLKYNIEISRGPSCNNVQSPVWQLFEDNKQVTCSDVWLLNNIGNAETSHFENCSFAVDHSRLSFPSGPFKMIISTLFNMHTSFSSVTTDVSGLGYINVEMDVLQNFPIHTTTEKVNFSVPLSTQHIDNFNLSIFTVFHVSYSGPDRFPILAIRVQFIENMICTRS